MASREFYRVVLAPLGIAPSASGVYVEFGALTLVERPPRDRIGSSATSGEGTQNLLCGYLAGAVLVGLLGNTWFGLWWLDPIAALVIAAVAVAEGRKAWRGESCACGACAVPTT